MKSSCLSAKNSFVASPWSMAVERASSYRVHDRSSLRYFSAFSRNEGVAREVKRGGGDMGGVLTRGNRGGTFSAR